MDSFRKEIGMCSYTIWMKERNGAGSPSVIFIRLRDNTALSFWLHPCKRILELTSLPSARTELLAPPELFSSYARKRAARLLSFVDMLADQFCLPRRNRVTTVELNA